MALLDDIKAAQLTARKNRNTTKASLLSTLLTEATTVPSETFAKGVAALRKQAEAEGWVLGRLEVETTNVRATAKRLLSEAMEVLNAKAEAEGWDAQRVLDEVDHATKVVTKEADELIAEFAAKAEAEGWPLGRLEAETTTLGQALQAWVPSDEEIRDVVAKFVKNAKATLEHLKAGGNAERIAEVELEISILSEFLPKQLTEAELGEVISNFKAANPGANVGMIMGHLKANYAGLYDGKSASALAKA